jgi:hypothetical protein
MGIEILKKSLSRFRLGWGGGGGTVPYGKDNQDVIIDHCYLQNVK